MTLQARSLCRALSLRGEIRVLVDDVSLVVESGSVLGVTGPSGSGKSTLLRVIMGLDARSSGEVLLDEQVVSINDLPRFRRHVAMVPQRLGLPEGPVETSFGEADPRPLLRDLGLPEEVLGRSWTSLSGGEARRARVAAACSFSPGYLVLDEPSEGLDAQSVVQLGAFLRARAGEGVGVLLVSHDEDLLARTAHHLLVLYEGAIHGEGSAAQLLPAAFRAISEGSP